MENKPFYKTVVGKIVISVASIAVLSATSVGIYKAVKLNSENNVKVENKAPKTAEQIREENFKEKFLDELPNMIEESYNAEAMVEVAKIRDVKILGINCENGNIFVGCTKHMHTKFLILNNPQLKDFSSYESLYNNFNKTFEVKSLNSRLEPSLANEIVEFALKQKKVKNYVLNNVGEYSNYELLNATNFFHSEGTYCTRLTVKFDDKVVNFKLGGGEESFFEQQEYFDAMKNSTSLKFDVGEIENYSSFEDYFANNNSKTVDFILQGAHDYVFGAN